MNLVHLHQPVHAAPIVVSVPHCGTYFPEDIAAEMDPNLTSFPDDTDWFVDQLYDFAPAMGMTLITATHSRWVIDLNRDPENKPLYKDGRIITALCPTTDFLGNNLYNDSRQAVDDQEILRRRKLYYDPYHTALQNHIQRLKQQHGKVLLWDCHSIRQYVPTIRTEKFPDLILGNADQMSCGKELIALTVENLSSDKMMTFSHNEPFKGGYITRAYGKPDQHQHTLQLEMSKVNYMDDDERRYDRHRAEKIREMLKRTFSELIKTLTKHNG